MIELQKIDCNCNDCIFMVRDMDKYKKSVEFHKKIQLEDFEMRKEKEQIREDAVFQFDKSYVSISYGNCTKLEKPVSFIPNTCQLDTQDCFKHRRDV